MPERDPAPPSGSRAPAGVDWRAGSAEGDQQCAEGVTAGGSPEVGQFAWDTVTGAWWWSDELYRLYGYEPHEVAPSMELFLQHKDPRDRARIDAVFERCLSLGGPFSCYHRVLDAEDKLKTVVVVGYGDRNAANTRTMRMHGFMVDVTASARQESSAAFEAAMTHRSEIEQVKGAIMLLHSLDADAAFAVIRGYSQAYNRKVSRIAATALAAFSRRPEAESITRGQLDQMLWDAVHQS